MATNSDIINALKKAAEAILRRPLSQDEVISLSEHFSRAQGSNHERALIALKEQTKMSDKQLMEKAAASDNTDRIMQELENLLK